MLQSVYTLIVVDARVACMVWGEIRTMKADEDRVGECGEEEEEKEEEETQKTGPIYALKVTLWRFAPRLF